MDLNHLETYFQEESEEILNTFNWKKIENFHTFLKKNNEAGGFFSRKDTLHIWERHILESVYHVYTISKLVSVSRETEILDVGSGPGLPGYIFYCLNQSPRITLLDSQKRKLQYMEEFIRKNEDSKEILVRYQRIEEHKKQYDIVTMRSVIPYPWSLEMVTHTIKKGGVFLPFLGKQFEDKKLEKDKMEKSGFQLERVEILEKLKFLGMRHIKFLKKISNENHSQKRDWAKIKKEIDSYNGKDSVH